MFVIITSYSCNIFSCLLFQGKETYILCTYKKCFQWKQIHFKKTIFFKTKNNRKKRKSKIIYSFYFLCTFVFRNKNCFLFYFKIAYWKKWIHHIDFFTTNRCYKLFIAIFFSIRSEKRAMLIYLKIQYLPTVQYLQKVNKGARGEWGRVVGSRNWTASVKLLVLFKSTVTN